MKDFNGTLPNGEQYKIKTIYVFESDNCRYMVKCDFPLDEKSLSAIKTEGLTGLMQAHNYSMNDIQDYLKS